VNRALPTHEGASAVRLRWVSRDAVPLLSWAAVAALVIAGVMALAGLPPIDLHGPLHFVGIMDPLCGGTRAARYTAQGELGLAWKYNPLGIVVVLGSLPLLARAALGWTTHRWIALEVNWTPRRRAFVITTVVVLFVLLEVRQQMRADLLMARQ
jgi:hypothetical protein